MADSACGIDMVSHAGLLLAQRVACGDGGRILGESFNMAGRSWCRLTRHWMPQSTMQKSWPVTCCRSGMLWATRELLTSFCWTTTAHPTQRDSINVTRMLPWPILAPDFKSFECLKSSEAPIEMEYYSHWHKWKHHSLPAGGWHRMAQCWL